MRLANTEADLECQKWGLITACSKLWQWEPTSRELELVAVLFFVKITIFAYFLPKTKSYINTRHLSELIFNCNSNVTELKTR